MKYSMKELIEMFMHFPEDMICDVDLAFMWDYDDDVVQYHKNLSQNDFEQLTMSYANTLYVFKGDWEKENLLDMPERLLFSMNIEENK